MINKSLTFEEFLEILNNLKTEKHKYMREGQRIMNNLYKYWPEEYSRITNTDFDCFFVDKKINKTINHLKSVWNRRDLEIANRVEYSVDRRQNKVFWEMNSEMTLNEFAGCITKYTKLIDLPQLIALIVKIVDNKELSIPLINHFEHLKNIHYKDNPDINKPFNLLNYEKNN